MNKYMPKRLKTWENGQFPETHHFPKLYQEEAESLNTLIETSEIEAIIDKTPGIQKP